MLPYTHEELADMKRRLEESIEKTEREHPEVRPLPPMTEDEAHELLNSWIATASRHILTLADCWLMGQTLACYRQAIEARMLGRKGRYYVISEADLDRLRGKSDVSGKL